MIGDEHGMQVLDSQNVLYIFITFVPDDDHRDFQAVVAPAPALRGTLSRAHFGLEDRFSQPDGFLEGFPTVHTEHHDEEVPCEIGYRCRVALVDRVDLNV